MMSLSGFIDGISYFFMLGFWSISMLTCINFVFGFLTSFEYKGFDLKSGIQYQKIEWSKQYQIWHGCAKQTSSKNPNCQVPNYTYFFYKKPIYKKLEAAAP